MTKQWGYVRETIAQATEAGNDPDTNLPRTGLPEYLNVIFPEVTDWKHNTSLKTPDGKLYHPDYRSESLKMIIEFDGTGHYQNPSQILKDIGHTKTYKQMGYKVIRIPYFIQLTNEVVKTMFGVDVQEELFDPNVASMGEKGENTPAFLCYEGIRRMAYEFTKYETQYTTNVEALRKMDKFLTALGVLEKEHETMTAERIRELEDFYGF